jgi:hypothetical protein
MPPKTRKAKSKPGRQTRLTDSFAIIGKSKNKDLESIDKERLELRKRLKRVASDELVPTPIEKKNEEEIPKHLQRYLSESYRPSLIAMLRSFDLDIKFGPCIGLTRLERWKRAQTLQLNPPKLIHDLLSLKTLQQDDELRESLWHNLVTQPVDPEDLQ